MLKVPNCAAGRVLFWAKRGFGSAASSVSGQAKGARTQVTQLKNGLRIASENVETETATVGVWINAGSRYESESNNGTAHFLEHMAFKGTGKRSQRDLELQIENMGGHLNAYTSREQTAYYAKVLKKDVGTAMEILADILQNAKHEAAAIEAERGVILREYEEVSRQHEEVIFDHLHAVAYQGTSLGRTILGPVKNIKKITRNMLGDFIRTHYLGSQMVIAAAGGVDHDTLVKQAEKLFGNLPSGNSSSQGNETTDPASLLAVHGASYGEPAIFTGSEVRLRDDSIPNAHMTIAVEGASWTSPDFIPLLVAQSIIGSWDRSMAGGANMSSDLAQQVARKNLAQSFVSFNTSYTDTGLFGIYLVSDRRYGLDDLVWLVQQSWMRLCLSATEEQVERAKIQLKSTYLLQLDGTTPLCEDIGRQILCYGKRFHLSDIFSMIDAVDVETVKSVAHKYIYDRCPAVAAFGPIEGMPDYNRIRAGMRWLRN